MNASLINLQHNRNIVRNFFINKNLPINQLTVLIIRICKIFRVNGLLCKLGLKNIKSEMTNFSNCSFSIEDLWSKHMYLVNLNLSLCWDSVGSCDLDSVNILDNVLIQKKACDWSLTFPVSGKCCRATSFDQTFCDYWIFIFKFTYYFVITVVSVRCPDPLMLFWVIITQNIQLRDFLYY